MVATHLPEASLLLGEVRDLQGEKPGVGGQQ